MRKHCAGFSMIEVLVAFVVAAVGLLGLGAMQLVTMKNVNNSQYRTMATLYAYDMAERMRSNQAAVDEYIGVDTEESEACPNCTDGALSDMDVGNWANEITANPDAGGLPSGVGTIEHNDDLYEITLEWDEQVREDDVGSVETQSYTLAIDL